MIAKNNILIIRKSTIYIRKSTNKILTLIYYRI